MEQYFSSYLTRFKQAIDAISPAEVDNVFKQVREAIDGDRQIFVFGNGGSAMNASHIATDMLKSVGDAIGKRVKMIALNDNVGLITAIGNDYSYEEIYSRQLSVLANPGDLVMTVSVSGSSPNLVKAFEWAKANGLQSVAIVGGKRGKLPALADTTIVIDSEHYGHVEDAQMAIFHMLAYAFVDNAAKFTAG